MSIISRNYKVGDFDRIMEFLADLYHRYHSYLNWFPDRFENSHEYLIHDLQIWEDKDRIVAMAHPEAKDSLDYFIQLDPEYGHLLDEIIDWIYLACEQALEKIAAKNK